MVTTADHVASVAGVGMLERGGTAADAAVAAATALAVTSPHLCGLGGDVLAVVRPVEGAPLALLSVGRAGSGAKAGAMRAEGLEVMPLRGDVRSVTVPGAVDGWLALHQRFGRLPLTTVLAPATAMAEDGFAASEILSLASHLVAGLAGASQLCPHGPLEPGARVRLPGVAATLRAVAERGRDGFYHGRAGQALLDLGRGLFVEPDLARPLAQWCDALSLRVWGHDVWTVPPPSQGYLTLAGTWIAEQVGLPVDPTDDRWPHLVVESARAAGHDRPSVLREDADGSVLLGAERLAAAADRVDVARAAPPDVAPDVAAGVPAPRPAAARLGEGDTTHLCALDADGLGVSLTQSNALDFGSHLVAGDTGIFLHDRGVGFSLVPGHPAELGPGRRPPHTLSPAAVTRPDGSLAHLLGTMGGDAQPQILLQLLARMLRGAEDPAAAVGAPRLALDAPGAGPFRLWWGDDLTVRVERDAPGTWTGALTARGHRVAEASILDPVAVGCAQIISLGPGDVDGPPIAAGAADPRGGGGDTAAR
jgi:gamma-glutamyltranspeptidase/glutathione hydrolase